MRYTNHRPIFSAVLAFTVLLTVSLACSAVTQIGQPGSGNIPTFTAVVIGQPAAAQTVPDMPTSMVSGTLSAPQTQAGIDNLGATAKPAGDSQSQYLGETTIKQGFALTADTVQDPAKPGVLYQSKQGTRLVAVEITVANISRDSLSVNPLNAVLIDASGSRYPLALAAVDQQLDTGILKKGEKARGWVAFQVSENAQPVAVEYGDGMLSLNVLRASLVPQPEGYQPGGDLASRTATPESTEFPTFLGDAVEKGGVAIVPVSVQDPAQPSQFYQSKNDKKLIAVEIVVANVTSDALNVNPLNATLVDSGGFTYRAELGGVDHQLPSLTLFAGEHVQGWVAFETPKDASAARIKYSLQAFGEDAITAGLAQAPYGRASILLPASPPPPALPKLDERVEKFGYALTANTLQDPATPGMLYQKREGYRLVAVEFTLENVSGDPISINPLYAYLVDSLGFVFQAKLGGIDNQIQVSSINRGEKVKGWVAFEIPEGASPASLKYAVGASQNATLQVGLTR